MQVIPQITVVIDLTRPAEEIQAVIVAITNMQPGRQLELLRQTDLWLGEVIAQLEQNEQQQPE